jgi:integrase
VLLLAASQWGWDDVPSRPLLGRSDLPKLPARLPRFTPRDELDLLMKAIEGLENPYQRTALLLVCWSGARKGEIRRLTVDCLDTYPDGYPRLRIPVGKTYTERMIPLHPQAAEALRELIELAKAAAPAARFDTWAQQPVRWVFMHRGQPMGKRYLFDEPLEIACHVAGLLDAQGRPTVSAHRFRHTVGTQLAEGGAQIQTIGVAVVLGKKWADVAWPGVMLLLRLPSLISCSPGWRRSVRGLARRRRGGAGVCRVRRGLGRCWPGSGCGLCVCRWG